MRELLACRIEKAWSNMSSDPGWFLIGISRDLKRRLCNSLAYPFGVLVETYVFELNKPKPSLKQLTLSVLIMAAVYFVLMFAWNYLWPSRYEARESLYLIALKVGLVSLFWGLGMTFWLPKSPKCKLVVDDQSITSVFEYTGWMKWYKIRKTVSAGKIRTIREINGSFGASGGLAASEQTRLGAWMWGGIYIPKTLPEYERLKALVESWEAPGSED